MTSEKGVKSFVSESEAEEIRKKKQEEWEKVRQADDPEERPEEVADYRTLYEKLQEQKDKKQEEWEEQHKLKNMIRGLESEETDFLDIVAKQQHEINKQRFDQENKELKGFRSAVSELQSSPSVADQRQTTRKVSQPATKKSQMDLIAGGIKRRKSSSSTDTTPEKKAKVDKEENTKSDEQPNPSLPVSTSARDTSNQASCSSSDEEDKNQIKPLHRKVLVPRCRINRTGDNRRQAITIPGLGIYSDSSDSESSSSDSEIVTGSSHIRYTNSYH